MSKNLTASRLTEKHNTFVRMTRFSTHLGPASKIRFVTEKFAIRFKYTFSWPYFRNLFFLALKRVHVFDFQKHQRFLTSGNYSHSPQ